MAAQKIDRRVLMRHPEPLRVRGKRMVEVEREAFLADYRARIADAYPRREDGKTLFPFRRLFMVATR